MCYLHISTSAFRNIVLLCSISCYIGARSISVRQLSCYIPSCHAHTCDEELITSVFAICIHTCESNANPTPWMFSHVIETTSHIHTCWSNVNPLSWMCAHVIESSHIHNIRHLRASHMRVPHGKYYFLVCLWPDKAFSLSVTYSKRVSVRNARVRIMRQ